MKHKMMHLRLLEADSRIHLLISIQIKMSYVELMRAGSLRPFADFVGIMFTVNCGMHAYVSAVSEFMPD